MQLENTKGAKALNRKYTDTGLNLSIQEVAIALDTLDDYEQLLYIL